MDITSNRIPATPRSKYARYGYGSNNISVSGGGGNANIDTSNFVKLKGQTSQSIEGTVAATGDIIAYQTNPEAGDFQFPIASTDALGTIKVGSGLKINEDGTLSVDGEIGGGGVSSWDDLTDKPSTFPSTWEQVTGKPTEFAPSAHTHVMNDITDFNGVTIDTDQTITGQKAFSKTILGQADVVAYSTGISREMFPIASTTALGCIKVGENLTITEDGTLNAQAGGGITSVTWNDILDKPIFSTVANSGSYTDLLNKPSLFSGNYNDLTNKPTIPTNTNQLTNGAGYITGINLSMWNNAATSVGDKKIGNSNNGNYVDIVEDLRITQNCTFSKTPKVGSTNVALVTDIHTHSNKSYLDNINQNLSTSSNVQHAQVKATGDVIAFSTGSGTQSPFKYWRPSVSSDGTLSWTNSTSETTPTSVNIKGANGQGVTYQWSGTSLRLGTINSSGSTTWGSYVNLKGDSGSGSGSWNGGQVTNAIIAPNLWINTTYSSNRLAVNGDSLFSGNAMVSSNLTVNGQLLLGTSSSSYKLAVNGQSNFNAAAHFAKDNTNTRIWGNAVDAWSNTSTGRPRLWLNYYKPTGWSYQSECFIGNGDGTGTQVATINADGNGKILIKNGTGTLSDSRLKTIFNKQENILSKIQNINVYDYTRNDDEDKILRTGVLAQEVAKVFPTLAVANYADEVTNERYYTVDYATLGTVIAVGGCKELHNIIKEQQVMINELESRLASLETKNHLKDEEANSVVSQNIQS